MYRRLISRDDILEFARISGDHGIHHTDQSQKLLAHGLLIATLPTKLGGDLNFIAREISFEFLKGVYEGETITCIGKIEKLMEQDTRFKAELLFSCSNENGEIVLKGKTKGMIWK